MISHIPNLHYLAPTTYEELIAMEKWAINQDKYSIAIRVPEGPVVHSNEEYDTDYTELNKFKMVYRGKKVAIIAVGNFFQKGETIRKLLANDGIDATLINPRYLSGIDEEMLESLKKDHQIIVTVEDGSLDGGFGERISRFYGPTNMRVLNFGIKKALYDRYDVNKLLHDNHLTDDQIFAKVKSILNEY
jgi:1-deoxy-D-xylulose-5-phosphate synthase